MVGFFPKIKIQKPRGDRHEPLDSEQSATKSQVLLTAAAHVLAELEAYAKDGGVFKVRGANTPTLKLYPRLFAWVSDKEEEQAICGVGKNHCPRCRGHTAASELEKTRLPLTVDSKLRRPHMRLDEECACVSAERRDPSSELAAQKWAAQRAAMLHGKGIADVSVKKIGTRFDTCVMLHELSRTQGPTFQWGLLSSRLLAACDCVFAVALTRFRCSCFELYEGPTGNLIPHSAGGLYAAILPDLLHVIETGIFPKFLRMLIALMSRSTRASPTQVRTIVEKRMRVISAFTDGLHSLLNFQHGW